MIKDYLVLTFRSLMHRKLRSWLTMLGIFIGIAAVVALISLGQGLEDAITSQFEELGTDKIIIQSKTLGPPGSTTNEALILKSNDLEVIKDVRGVEDAAGILMKTGPVNFKDELGAFLPIDQQGIIRDFPATLERELNSQLSGL